ncbi:MAG TPA: hypothetical protein DCY79_05725 [Planctomycetaceae bacterium]|nr:hypothetical protein [Blastopirellula sp.]HAY79290.1 hypothetical protein [Planctomycetaceae bacterium]
MRLVGRACPACLLRKDRPHGPASQGLFVLDVGAGRTNVPHHGRRVREIRKTISQRENTMAYDDTLVVNHLQETHATELLTDREKQLVGLAVTMTRGCQVCTRNRIEKARGSGITDEELSALVAVTAAVNSGVTAATARVAFGMLQSDSNEDCGNTCAPPAK